MYVLYILAYQNITDNNEAYIAAKKAKRYTQAKRRTKDRHNDTQTTKQKNSE